MSTPLAKSLVGSVPPLLLAGLLYGGAGAGLLVVLVARRLLSSRRMSVPPRRDLLWLGGGILVGGVLGPVALMYGLTTTPASSASLLLNLEAVFTALLAWFLFRENFDRRIAFGMLAIVLGGVVLAWAPMEAGRISGTALGLGSVATIGLAVVLAFAFGYAFTMVPLRRSGMDWSAVFRLAFAADTASITIMEIVDNAIMLMIPGAMDAGLTSLLFWGALALSLAVAGAAAYPVNRWLIARGRGHAVVHAHHDH
jgi:drug/metabolite transporter (DMT)-like permease